VCVFIIQYLTEEYVDEFIALDQQVYSTEYQVDKMVTLERLRQNPYTDLIVTDGKHLVGYLSLCPISPVVYQNIIHGVISEQEIEKHVISYKKMGYYDVYLSSIVINKKRYPHFTSQLLFQCLEQHLSLLRKRGIFIRYILGVAVSIAGGKTLQKMYFHEIKENVFVYACRKQGIRFFHTHMCKITYDIPNKDGVKAIFSWGSV